MTTEVELKEIKTMLTDLAKTVESMNTLIAERLIGSVEPLPDEIQATKEYQVAKKNNTAELIPWKDRQICRGIMFAGNQRIYR